MQKKNDLKKQWRKEWNTKRHDAFNAAAHALEEARILYELKEPRPLPVRLINPFKRRAAQKAYDAAAAAEKAELEYGLLIQGNNGKKDTKENL